MENENPEILNNLHPPFKLEIVDGRLQNLCKEAIFELIRGIKDPEHPYSLEQLKVVDLDDVSILEVTNNSADHPVLCKKGLPLKSIRVIFTPTVPHCSMAGIIGLSIIRQISKHTNVYLTVEIKEGTHNTDFVLNKQLSDKDRVMAAFQNIYLMNVINSCIVDGDNIVIDE